MKTQHRLASFPSMGPYQTGPIPANHETLHKHSFIVEKSSPRLVGLFGSLVEGFDDRQLRVLFRRTFQAVSALTLQDLGNEFGVCRERVRQIESDCVAVVRRRLAAPRYRPLLEASQKVSSALGVAVPLTMAEAAGYVRGESPAAMEENLSPELFLHGFLLSEGGSYEARAGWMIKRPASPFIRKTRMITSSLLKHSPASADRLLERVCALGIHREVAPHWVASFGEARLVGRLAIRWQGNLADKAVALLECGREPMTNRQILELLGSSRTIETLNNYLSVDLRFERYKRGLYGLKSWHSAPVH